MTYNTVCIIYVYMCTYTYTMLPVEETCEKFAMKKGSDRTFTSKVSNYHLNCLSSAAKEAAINGDTGSVHHAASGIVQ